MSTVLLHFNPGDSGVWFVSIMDIVLSLAICAPLMELVNYGTRMGEITVVMHNIDETKGLKPIPAPYSSST